MQFGKARFMDAISEVARAAGVAGAARKPLGTAIYGSGMRAPESHRASTNRSVTLLLIGGGETCDVDAYKVVNQAFTLLLVGRDEWAPRTAFRKLAECVAPLRSPARAEGKAR